jgi:hypothetical protein
MYGVGRDSYLRQGVRPADYHPHDVNARRDNLPDNVFNYLKAQAAREEFAHYVHETQKARALAVMTSGHGGKKMQTGDTGAARVEQAVLGAQVRMAERAKCLRELYTAERAQWDSELRDRGLALDDGLR